jgi:predicted ester cyclase
MPPEERKAAYRSIIEAVNAGDFDAMDALFAANMVDHNPVPGQVPGLAEFKQWMATARRSFPDLRGTVGHVLAEGDLVAGPGRRSPHLAWHPGGTVRGGCSNRPVRGLRGVPHRPIRG